MMAWRAYYVSTFSGIEAATVAWAPLGWVPVCFSEIDPFPSAVLEERFPSVPNLGDITRIDWSDLSGLVDIVVGGSPCQSFSIAGNREGLSGESGLMWEYVRAVQEIRPEWLVWENVPGALSSSGGEDFRCLLESLDALGYGLAWRVLDAQFFGVAQRRERVFLVGRLGDVEGPCEVLFERGGMPWDPPSSREKRKELAAGAGGGAACAGFAWHHGGNTGLGVQEETSATIESNMPPAVYQIAGNIIGREDKNGGHQLGVTDPDEHGAFTLNTADRHAVVAFAANQRGEVRLQGGDGSVTGAIPANQSGKQINGVVCMADAETNASIDRDLSGSLKVNNDRSQPIVIDCRNDAVNGEVSGTLQAKSNGGYSLNYVNPVMNNGIVRRLTPRECERLQGFPDDWTLIPYRGKPAGECPDTPRYKALGNSMAVPVMRWIGERIQEVMDREETGE